MLIRFLNANKGEKLQLDNINMAVCKVKGAEDIPLPQYMTLNASGMDLAANVQELTVLDPGEFRLIPCGIRISLPSGYEAQVRPRSGLAAKYGVTVLNSPGTIDADYRGEIKVILINHGKNKFTIKRGDRIAQLVISKVVRINILESRHLSKTKRGEGGFGHTGI